MWHEHMQQEKTVN